MSASFEHIRDLFLVQQFPDGLWVRLAPGQMIAHLPLHSVDIVGDGLLRDMGRGVWTLWMVFGRVMRESPPY